jgi:hypothetical protein
MMHYRSHQARWQYIPLAAPKLTRWQRFWRWLDDLFAPVMVDEGRRRIDPAQPYGHWSAGFHPPTMPQAKEKAR